MFRGSRLFISRSAMWFGTNLYGPSSMPISSIGRLRRPYENNLDRQSLAYRMLDFLKRGRLIRRGLPYFQWATAGTDEKLRDRAALFSHCDGAALDQSAKDLFAKLARSSRFRNHPGAARGDEALTCALQWWHG